MPTTTAKVTQDGSISIPKTLGAKFGLIPGMELVCIDLGDGHLVFRGKRKGTLTDIHEALSMDEWDK
jgi:bifunctional DNA-binding transcriptional regulator/antitoxin component of YhaV-PrlF toxin-antitoxin module